jgi:hypothetical protein
LIKRPQQVADERALDHLALVLHKAFFLNWD